MFDRKSPRILVVRRENIGDLVCATPLIAVIRQLVPNAFIACLVNSYNRDVLTNNSDIDEVFCYIKPKHRDASTSRFRAWAEYLGTWLAMRRHGFDYAVLATTDFLDKDIRLLRSIAPRHIVALAKQGNPLEHVDLVVPYPDPDPKHIVEQLCLLGVVFEKPGKMPSMEHFSANALKPDCKPLPSLNITPSSKLMAQARARLMLENTAPDETIVAVHISSRNPAQRWPGASFVEYMHELSTNNCFRFVLFWSPGAENNALHPGDDEKAAYILTQSADIPIVPCPTSTLTELINGIALCSLFVGSDGGAMHVAAALGKPVVCFFGNADPTRWHPWRVPYRLLRPSSMCVADITPREALEATTALIREVSPEKLKCRLGTDVA